MRNEQTQAIEINNEMVVKYQKIAGERNHGFTHQNTENSNENSTTSEAMKVIENK